MIASEAPWQPILAEIGDLLGHVDRRQFQDLLAAFRDEPRRTFWSGQGRSGLIAQMAAMRLMHAGLAVHVVGEATAPAVARGDRFVLVCGSGRTPVSVGHARIAKAAGAELVLVTHKPESDLGRMADRVLTIPMDATVQFGGTLFEQGCLIVLDALALHLTGASDAAYGAMWARHTNLQ